MVGSNIVVETILLLSARERVEVTNIMHPSCHCHRSKRRLAFHACISILLRAIVMFAFVFAAHGFRSGCTTSSSSSRRLRLRMMHREGKVGTNDCSDTHKKQRRKFIQQSSASIASLCLPVLLPQQQRAALATDYEVTQRLPSEPYTRTPASPADKFQFSYTVTPPSSFVASNKPLKTHLDEINFAPPDIRGYTLGITVDPVRISSIQQFGSPEEVAARVVTAEVARDGVFEVTLAKDPKEDAASGGGDGGYDIEYISDGKRGKKRFVTRIYVKNGFLYVLTVQSKESEYDKAREAEVFECVKSFKPLS